jgi:hypothetical protein
MIDIFQIAIYEIFLDSYLILLDTEILKITLHFILSYKII